VRIECDGFTLEVVKVKGGWAQKATMGGESRYRFYHYKREAERTLSEWENYQPSGVFRREFHHNFNSAEELGLSPMLKDKDEGRASRKGEDDGERD